MAFCLLFFCVPVLSCMTSISGCGCFVVAVCAGMSIEEIFLSCVIIGGCGPFLCFLSIETDSINNKIIGWSGY